MRFAVGVDGGRPGFSMQHGGKGGEYNISEGWFFTTGSEEIIWGRC
jgi:hypothetical protein